MAPEDWSLGPVKCFQTEEHYSCTMRSKQNERRHEISNNVAFLQVKTQTSLCSLLLSFETLNDVQSVAKHSENIQATSKGSDQTVCICAGGSEALLVAHTTLLEISCRGSNIYVVPITCHKILGLVKYFILW